MAARALVVDDDRSWQQILGEILLEADLEVDVADSLQSALGLIPKHNHRLAIVDISLIAPDHHNRDGLTVLAAIQKHNPACVTILLTGFATVEIAVNALTELGAYTCLRKEMFHRGQFKELVRRALSAPIPQLPENESTIDFIQEKTKNTEPGQTVEPSLILIVEDDAGWRSIFEEVLVDAGYRLRLCTSFGEAIGFLRRETYALAVVDLSLEGRITAFPKGEASEEQPYEGLRLLSSIHTNGAPVVLVSGVASSEEIERAYRGEEIFAFIEKRTFDRRSFLQIVNEAILLTVLSSEFSRLTQRERDVLELLSQGLTNKEIAFTLVITPNTVKRHLKAIFEKLDIHTRSAAAALAVNWFTKPLLEEKKRSDS